MLVYRFEGVPRNPLSVALKNVLTLGIHTKVWLYRVNREMDGREGFHIHMGWLAVMLWVPFVTPAIVKFQTAARLNQMVSDPVVIPLLRARMLGWISLVPVLGAGFYAYWVQGSLNKYWFWHRRRERFQLNVEKIKELSREPESEALLQKRFALEEDCRRIEREMEEEIEAARIQWGQEKFQARKKRADMHAERGRLTRKEAQRLRQKEKEERKQRRARRRRERSFLARYRPRRADPDKDEAWEPATPVPQRHPDEIVALAQKEDREPDRKESREIKRATKLIEAREKESLRLEKRRAKLLAQKRRREEREKAKEERKAAKKKAGKGKKRGEGAPGAPPEGLPKRRFLGLLPPQRDPEVDAHWQVLTPRPDRTPQEIESAAKAEDREPTKKELKEIKRAENLMLKREKESERLEKMREAARKKREKEESARNTREEKKKQRESAKKEKEQEKKGRKKEREEEPKQKGKKRAVKPKKAKKAEKPSKEKAPRKEKKPAKKSEKKSKKTKGADKAEEPGGGPASSSGLKVVRVRCPRCATQVPVKKQDDRPARLTCPSCGLVGKV